MLAHGTERSKGILLGFKESIPFQIISLDSDPEGRYIVAHVKLHKESFTVVSLYIEPQIVLPERARVMSEIMGKVAQVGNSRVLFCGDFNAYLDAKLDHSATAPALAFAGRTRQLVEFVNLHELTDVWRALHSDERRFTSFGSGSPTRIDLALASPSMLTHIENSFIGTSYLSDHSPLYVDFTLDQTVRGPGCWRLPQYILTDPVYVKRIENVIDSVVQENPQLDDHQTWDFLKVSIRLETIKFVSERHQAKKAWVKQLDDDIAAITQARDKVVNNRPAVHHYSNRLKLMQWEREEIVRFHTEQARWYKLAKKHYESNRSTRYYFQLPGCRYDAIKWLKTQQGETIHSSQQILQECHSFYTKLYKQTPHEEALNEDLQ